ncbi:MAG: hypothetical protein SFW66_01775 [Gammaproteobacteria bacterium]|nr:hypothetical protein [Gammaproteobacteria bacterium]
MFRKPRLAVNHVVSLNALFVKPCTKSFDSNLLRTFSTKLDQNLNRIYNPPEYVFGDILHRDANVRNAAIKDLHDKIANMPEAECEVFVQQINSLRNAQYSISPTCQFFPLKQDILNKSHIDKSFLRNNETIIQIQEMAEERLRGFKIHFQ